MNAKTLVFLLLLTAAIGGVAVYNRTQRQVAVTFPTASGPVLPGLGDKVNDVTLIELQHAGKSHILEKRGDGWVMASMDGYPAKFDEVRETLIALSNLKLREAKTSNPELYEKLGVQDPPKEPPTTEEAVKNASSPEPKQQSTLVRVKAADKDLGAIVLGQRTFSKAGERDRNGIYVRRDGEKQSWHAEGDLMLQTDPLNWIEREVMRVDRRRVKSVTLTHPDGAIVAAVKPTVLDPNFALANMPEGRSLKSPAIANSLGSLTESVQLAGVAKRENRTLETTATLQADVRTFDGLVVTVKAEIPASPEANGWATIDVSVDEALLIEEQKKIDEAAAAAAAIDDAATTDTQAAPTPTPAPTPDPRPEYLSAPADVRVEAEKLQAKVGPWAFQLPGYKAQQFNKRMIDLLAEEEVAPSPTPEPASTESAVPPPSIDLATMEKALTPPTATEPTPAPTPEATPTPEPSPQPTPEPTPAPSPEPSPEPTPTPESTPETTPEPTPVETPAQP